MLGGELLIGRLSSLLKLSQPHTNVNQRGVTAEHVQSALQEIGL